MLRHDQYQNTSIRTFNHAHFAQINFNFQSTSDLNRRAAFIIKKLKWDLERRAAVIIKKLKWDPERYFKAHVQLDDAIVWNRNYELYNHFFFSATFCLSSSLVLNAKLHLTHYNFNITSLWAWWRVTKKRGHYCLWVTSILNEIKNIYFLK